MAVGSDYSVTKTRKRSGTNGNIKVVIVSSRNSVNFPYQFTIQLSLPVSSIVRICDVFSYSLPTVDC